MTIEVALGAPHGRTASTHGWTVSTKYGRQSTEGGARGGRLSVDGACNQEPDGDTRRRDSDLDRFGPSD